MRRATAFVVIGLLAAACGGGGGSNQASPSASASASSSPSPSGTPANCTDESKGAVFDLTMANTAFSPSCVVTKSAQSIHISNHDSFLHNFTIPGTQVDVDVQPGSDFNGESAGLAPGVYPFLCKYHKAQGMTGTIVVT